MISGPAVDVEVRVTGRLNLTLDLLEEIFCLQLLPLGYACYSRVNIFVDDPNKSSTLYHLLIHERCKWNLNILCHRIHFEPSLAP